jgi:hypothetical protein
MCKKITKKTPLYHLQRELKLKHNSLPSAMGNQSTVKHSSLPSAMGNQSKTQQPAIFIGKSKLNTTACHLQREIKVL